MWFQIFSISFQLTGAIILLLWCLKGAKKENIIKRYFPGSNVIERDDENNCILYKDKLRVASREVYINIVAFCDLIVGYGLSFYADQSDNKTVAFITSMIITAVLLVVEYMIAHLISVLRYKEDIIEKYEVLEKYGVDTIVTNKEIDDMFNEMMDN